jgi:hypothetical protein
MPRVYPFLVAQSRELDLHHTIQTNVARLRIAHDHAPLGGADPQFRRRGEHGQLEGARPTDREDPSLVGMVDSRFDLDLMAMKKRLQEVGKPSKVILIAIARKRLTILDAIVRDQTGWKPMHA